MKNSRIFQHEKNPKISKNRKNRLEKNHCGLNFYWILNIFIPKFSKSFIIWFIKILIDTIYILFIFGHRCWIYFGTANVVAPVRCHGISFGNVNLDLWRFNASLEFSELIRIAWYLFSLDMFIKILVYSYEEKKKKKKEKTVETILFFISVVFKQIFSFDGYIFLYF